MRGGSAARMELREGRAKLSLIPGQHDSSHVLRLEAENRLSSSKVLRCTIKHFSPVAQYGSFLRPALLRGAQRGGILPADA